ncbi:hypothetical protein LOTGIDRAFT_167354 [Lottia gigantea]|uniref:Ig-like domain-containing protein n=1 Tax=Lottia gigantea TaxID=225164 RepID=V3ZUP9_LOTGI|nr:hypothetical protein LOTGIDRAFT_167354 [Lottia gigantea]ESO86305.1 hypothetical protein LOTGIDRAFT_167354 [Lottia gigantea]
MLWSGEWIRVRVHQMEPDLVDVGATLEEALQLKREHDELIIKLKSKEGEVQQLLQRADTYVDENRSQSDVHAAMAVTLNEAWKALNEKLDLRGQMLEQSISFHNSVQDLNKKMEQAQNKISNVPLASNVELARSLLQQHNDIKSDILESSKVTLDMGHALLQHIKEMGVHADIQNKHATTAACYGIEHLLELLHDRRRHLEELWELRRQKLEQCLQLCQLDQEVHKILEWFRTTGAEYLNRSQLGNSYSAALRLQEEHNKFETQARDIQETVLQLIRTADQLLRRTNLDAEGVRQRLLTVDNECENFMNQLDNRRRNITMSVSFFNLQETALTKLEQIEVQLNSTDLPRNSTELAERHAQLSNAIVECSTPALREGRLLLERVNRGDSGADDVRQKMDELQVRCAHLESLCKARRAQAWERSQTYLQFQEKYNSAIDWIEELCTVMVTEHNDLGKNQPESESLQDQHRKFESTAAGTYEYGKQLLQGALVLRRSLRYELEPNNERVYRLEEAWKKFTQGTSERTNRLTVASMFMTASDKVNDRIEQILVVISQALDNQITVDEVLTQYQIPKDKLQTWLTQICMATLKRHGNMGNDLNSAKDFLEIHEQIDEDIRDKNADMEALSAAVVNLVKSGDQEAQAAAEKVDALHKQITRIRRMVEIRIQLALLYVSFYRLGHQLKHNLDGLEHIMRSETEDLQDLTETAVSQMQELFSKTANIHSQFEEKGKTFLNNSSTLSEDSSMEIRQPTLLVEQYLSEMREQMNTLSVHYESWTQKISSSKQFKSQWHQFIQDARRIVVNENGIHSLIIKFVSRRDAGTYNCLALNKAGEDRFTITLNVTPKEEKQPPRFIERVQNFTVKEGNPVTLSCHAVGMPTPLMSWQKDGHHVTPTHDMRVNTEGGRSALYIEDTKLSDAAWYQCTAANTSGSATTRAKLVVQEYMCHAANPGGECNTKAEILPEVRKVQDEPLVSDLSPVQEILARAQAPKKPEKEFYRTPTEKLIDRRSEERMLAQPDEPLSAGVSDSEFTVSGFERKLMEEINYRDGKIKMMSETETEYDSEQPEERVINTQPPEILQQLNDTQLIEGGDATFVCKIVGKPRPKIAWYRNGKRIKKSNRYDITYGQDNMSVLKIRVTLPEDTGYYTVLAVNSVGKATTSAQLYVDKLGNIDATSFMEPESLKKMLKRYDKKAKLLSIYHFSLDL